MSSRKQHQYPPHMPPRRKQPSASPASSPDPLQIIPSAREPKTPERDSECINVLPTSPLLPRLSRGPRKNKGIPVVELSSPRKRKAVDDAKGQGSAKRVRTPLSKTEAGSNRATPTPRGKAQASSTKAKGKGKEKEQDPNDHTPLKTKAPPAELRTPVSLPKPTPSRSTTKKPLGSLGSSTKKPLPTPTKPPLPNFDDAFLDSPSTSTAILSREAFLANEALKRQRDARNFIFEGDVNAVRATRSGRVVVPLKEDSGSEDEEIVGGGPGDEYEEEAGAEPEDRTGGAPGIALENGDLPLEIEKADFIPDIIFRSNPPTPSKPKPVKVPIIAPLPACARRHVIDILSTLTSSNIATHPLPFVDEETNEALQGLVSLLKGTVERGEGNSGLIVGARGVGKTRTVARALSLLQSSSKNTPIVVKLSGLAQTNDRLAIREMGRQIAEAEGKKVSEGDDLAEGENDEDEEYAPTTLPSHLLALLTAPSPRAIIIVIEEFDLFTEHARQALLYCLLDVVQSVKTGSVETTGRGVAVIGVTSRIDTLLLLEKRVKSRFSHRMWRVASPLVHDGIGYKALLRRALTPWEYRSGEEDGPVEKVEKAWKGDWQFAVETLLEEPRITKSLDRMTGLTTDVRNLYRPFILPVAQVLSSQLDFIPVQRIVESVVTQIDNAGWGLQTAKLKGLPQPAVGVLIISKHLAYAGREEFNFAQVEEEYLRFSRTKLVGSGKTRWPVGVLRTAFEHLLKLGLLASTSNSHVKPRFARVRCTLSPHEIAGWCKGEGGLGLGPELSSWGKMMGGHV